jgi:hypothetical protein
LRAYSRVYRGFTTLRPRAPSRCGYGIRSEAERIIVRFLTISRLSFLWEVSGHVTWSILIIDKSFLSQRENRPSCRARIVVWGGVQVIVLCRAPLIVVTQQVVLSYDLHF